MNPANAIFRMFGQRTFPNPDDVPSGAAQGAIYQMLHVTPVMVAEFGS